jgi:hypothetical protein
VLHSFGSASFAGMLLPADGRLAANMPEGWQPLKTVSATYSAAGAMAQSSS